MKTVTIQEEYAKNPELKESDVNAIKEWISRQPHLPTVSDEMVVIFLHSCYYRMEAAKKTIENYYTIRTHAPEVFGNRKVDDPGLTEAFKTLQLAILPGRTSEGYVIAYAKLARLEPELYVLADAFKAMFMAVDLFSAQHGTSPGLVVVVDNYGVGLGHIPRINMSVMRKLIVYMQDGIPERLKAIHQVNCSRFIEVFMNMFKPFMKSELLQMFHFHPPGSKEIFEAIPKEILPSDIGGDGKSMTESNAETVEWLTKNRGWFDNQQNQVVDENKRVGKMSNENTLFGTDGSFKKLDFD